MLRSVSAALLAVLVAGIVACSGPAPDPVSPEEMEVSRSGSFITYEWTPPTTGSPVITYDVELAIMHGDTLRQITAFEHATFPYSEGTAVRCRVRGVDALSRSGPWSEWSTWHAWVGGPRVHAD